MFKWIAIVVAVLAVVLVVGGWFISPKLSVARSVVVAAPADKVYALVASPRAWKEGSVWNRRGPAMKIEYSGPESGTGAAWTWQSPSEGDGKMTRSWPTA